MHFTFTNFIVSYTSKCVNSLFPEVLLEIPSTSVGIEAVPSSLPHHLKVNFLPPYYSSQIHLCLPPPHRQHTLLLIILTDTCPMELGLFPCEHFRLERVFDKHFIKRKAWTQIFSISIRFSTCHRYFHSGVNVCGTLLL